MIATVLMRRASEESGECAFTFIENGVANSLTYRELDYEAKKIASALDQRYVLAAELFF